MTTASLVVGLVALAIPAFAELPPHAVDVGYGTWTCERGYLMRGRECIDEATVPHGPTVEISEVPDAVTPGFEAELLRAAREHSELNIFEAPPQRQSAPPPAAAAPPAQYELPLIFITGPNIHGCQGVPGNRVCF